MDKLQNGIQAASQVIVSTIGICALASSAWNGSSLGMAVNQAVIPYFSKAPAIVQSVKVPTVKTKCRIIDGEKYCK